MDRQIFTLHHTQFFRYISMVNWGKYTKLDFHILDDNIEQRINNVKNNTERLILSKCVF